MPKVRTDIKDLKEYGRTSTYEDKYPWLSQVGDGKVRELVAGKDFTTRPETVRQGLKNWAKRNGVKLTIKTEGKNVLVQAPVRRVAKRKTR